MLKQFSCQNISVSAPAPSTDGSTALGINRLSANGRNRRGKHETGIPSGYRTKHLTEVKRQILLALEQIKVYFSFLFILSSLFS